MNQEQIKARLLEIRSSAEPFSVVLSGKKSGKVDGLYKSDSREIILHNKNFSSDRELMYTAIHEYAHHLQFSESPVPISTRAHTVQFWGLFHSLLDEAESKELYSNPFQEIVAFTELTEKIKSKFLLVNGELMKELGGLLKEAQTLCEQYKTSFTDYLDRVLAIPRSSASTIIKAEELDLDPRVGFENMRTLTRIRDPELRQEAENALLDGISPDRVKLEYGAPKTVLDPLAQLQQEKTRIEKQMKRLESRIRDLNRRIQELERSAPPDPARQRTPAALDEDTGGGLLPRRDQEAADISPREQ